MQKYQELADFIIKNVGGKENISDLRHCVTRLRFVLKDASIAQEEALKNRDDIVTVMQASGQFQVVIGNHVADVYQTVMESLGEFEASDDTTKMSLANRFINTLSGSFQPVLAVLAASGMIKGFLALCVAFNWIAADSGTHLMLNGIGDAIFQFLPIVLGYTSAKVFKLNPFLGLVIGAALVYPNLQLSAFKGSTPIGEFMGQDVYTKVFGLPFIAQNYLSTVIPVLFVTWFASKVEKLFTKIIPEVVRMFLVPFFVLLIAIPVGFLVIGPILNNATVFVGSAYNNLYDFSSIIAGTLLAFVWPILVIFGLHWGIVPLGLVMLQQFGYTTVLGPVIGTTFAQTAVVMAMYLKFKDKKDKQLAIPSIISGIFGVTEPIIYGILLKRRKPLMYALIGGAFGGLVIGIGKVAALRSGGLGIFSIFSYINPNGDLTGIIYVVIAILLSSIVSFLLTYFFWNDTAEDARQDAKHQKTTDVKVYRPLKGDVFPLSQSKDQAFASGSLGDGVLIYPSDNTVYAPFDGNVVTLFPSKHAVGIISKEGVEVLIHIGIDTVNLNGEHFEAFVQQGQTVKKGDRLIRFDAHAIVDKGYNIETVVVLTNSNDLLEVLHLEKQDALLAVIL